MTLKLFRLCLFRFFSLDFFLCNYFLFSSLPFVHTRLFREIIWLSEMYYCNNLMTSNDRLGTYHKHSGVNSSKWSEHISLTVCLECGNQQTNRFVALHSFHIKICLFTVRTVYIKLLFRQKTSCHFGVICTFWFPLPTGNRVLFNLQNEFGFSFTLLDLYSRESKVFNWKKLNV